MKVKVSELSGPALDWAVGKAVGLELKVPDGFNKPYWHMGGELYCSKFQPSTEWMQGGPLIQRFAVTLAPYSVDVSGKPHYWVAEPWGDCPEPIDGETALIAACRAIVAGKFSEEIEIPDELLTPA